MQLIRGDDAAPSIPADWKAVAYNVEPGVEQERWLDALNWDGKSLFIDLTLARLVVARAIRKARVPAMAELDKEFMLALENGANTDDIVARKRAWRVAPEAVNTATTLGDLIDLLPN